MTMSDKFRI